MGDLADTVEAALIRRNEELETRLREIYGWAQVCPHGCYERRGRLRCTRCGTIWPCPTERIRRIAAGEC